MKKIVYIVAIMAILTVLIVVFGLSFRKSQFRKLDKYASDVTSQITSEMSDETLIRQLFMFYFQLDDSDSLKKLSPGGIFIHTNNIPLLKNGEQDIAAVHSLIEKINDTYRKNNLPLPIYSIDQEGGRVRRIRAGVTDFPSAMTISEAYLESGRTDIPLLAAFHTCMQLRSHGIQWPLTPVADVQINPDNPVIGERSFGSDPETVYKMVSQYVMGLQDARCMTSIKHFPGHGDTNLDSHRDLPEIHKSAKELSKAELYPYQKIINSRQAPWGIMSAHIIFREISEEPATLSRAWLTDKLRNEWNYQGIVITDDLAMNAVNIYQKKMKIENVAVNAFLAGADILLYVFQPRESLEMLQGFIKAYENKIIPRSRILESAKRIINRKIQLGLMDQYMRDHMQNWPKEFQIKAEVLLKRSTEIEENIKNIESQLAKPDSVNNFISKHGIKILYGKSPEKAGSKFNMHAFPLFTDIAENDPDYNIIKQKNIVMYPITALSRTNCPEKCIILQTQTAPIENLFTIKRNLSAIVFSVNDPFPRKKIQPYLRDDDTLVTTFSPTPTSRKKLIELYLENTLPPAAGVKY